MCFTTWKVSTDGVFFWSVFPCICTIFTQYFRHVSLFSIKSVYITIFLFSYLKNNVKFNVKLHWSKENIKWWKNILEQCIFPIEQQGGIFIKGFNPSLPESFTAKKKKFSIKAFFSKCDQIQIRSFLYWRNSKWKLSFFVQCFLWFLTKPFFFSWAKTPKLPKECDWL